MSLLDSFDAKLFNSVDRDEDGGIDVAHDILILMIWTLARDDTDAYSGIIGRDLADGKVVGDPAVDVAAVLVEKIIEKKGKIGAHVEGGQAAHVWMGTIRNVFGGVHRLVVCATNQLLTEAGMQLGKGDVFLDFEHRHFFQLFLKNGKGHRPHTIHHIHHIDVRNLFKKSLLCHGDHDFCWCVSNTHQIRNDGTNRGANKFVYARQLVLILQILNRAQKSKSTNRTPRKHHCIIFHVYPPPLFL